MTERPDLLVYRVRWWEHSRKCNGGPGLIYEVLGCNMDCAPCYVPIPLLRADMRLPEFQKMYQALPQALRHLPQDPLILARYARERWDKRDRFAATRYVEISGGEQSLNDRFGEFVRHAKDQGLTVIDNTNALQIAKNPGCLEKFAGLEDTLQFMFSIKGITPPEFNRYTTAAGKHYLSPFIASRETRSRGFDKYFVQVMLDTIARPGHIEEDCDRLAGLLDGYGIDRRLVICDRVMEQVRGHWFPTRQKMLDRGYYHREGDKIVRDTDPLAVAKYLKLRHGISSKCAK